MALCGKSDGPQAMTDDSGINLVKLCLELENRFGIRQLRQICSELGLNAEQFGLQNRLLKKVGVVALVADLESRGQLEELLLISRKHNSEFALDGYDFAEVEWRPRPLHETIVESVNRALGLPASAHFTYIESGISNNWTRQPVATGCMEWRPRFDGYMGPLSADPSLGLALQRARTAIESETATAYIGNSYGLPESGMGSFPCIVVAPTVDPFDIIRIEQTVATDGNADVDIFGLLRELGVLHSRYGIDIRAADESTLEFFLLTLPKSSRPAIHKWLKRIAPDAYRDLWVEYVPEGVPWGPIRLWWD
jgi:hypothetical protein